MSIYQRSFRRRCVALSRRVPACSLEAPVLDWGPGTCPFFGDSDMAAAGQSRRADSEAEPLAAALATVAADSDSPGSSAAVTTWAALREAGADDSEAEAGRERPPAIGVARALRREYYSRISVIYRRVRGTECCAA